MKPIKQVIYWEQGSNLCSMGRKYPQLEVRAKTYKKTITEREDAGGGWYGAKTEKRIVEVTDYLVYYDNEYLGEISMYTVMFLTPNKYHLIIKAKQQPLFETIKSLRNESAFPEQSKNQP